MDPLGFGGHDVMIYRSYGNAPVMSVDPYGLTVHVISIEVSDWDPAPVKLLKYKSVKFALGPLDAKEPSTGKDRFAYAFRVHIKSKVDCGDTIKKNMTFK